MIQHSEACKSAWAIETHAEWDKFNAAWHFTCTEDCVNEMGHAKPVSTGWTADDPPTHLQQFIAKEIPMPERHTVIVRNVVEQQVRLDGEEVLIKTDATERTLFFETAEMADIFIGSLADPYPATDSGHWSSWIDGVEDKIASAHDCADTFPTVRVRDGVGAITIGCPTGQPVLVLPADYGEDRNKG